MKNKKIIIFLGVIIVLVVLFVMFGKDPSNNNEPNVPVQTIGWKNIEFKNILTGQITKIEDFKGKPILLETFAVWCPTCLKQQKEIKKLKELEGDSIIHISIDIDPNEDEELVEKHAQENNLDWIFAISPVEMTNKLIEAFGQTVISAPSAPVVLICEDQNAHFLKKGVKTVNELKLEIGKKCN